MTGQLSRPSKQKSLVVATAKQPLELFAAISFKIRQLLQLKKILRTIVTNV
jgi:hypothetical protein